MKKTITYFSEKKNLATICSLRIMEIQYLRYKCKAYYDNPSTGVQRKVWRTNISTIDQSSDIDSSVDTSNDCLGWLYFSWSDGLYYFVLPTNCSGHLLLNCMLNSSINFPVCKKLVFSKYLYNIGISAIYENAAI